MNHAVFVTSDAIRGRFCQAMSDMYRSEVPQYGVLLKLVEDLNRAVLERDPDLAERLRDTGELARLNVERHGAIRVGTAAELAMLRRLFAVLGMYPVGYYDLSAAGVPVHSTAFRPIDDQALAANPFRVFTSLLRLELINDSALRDRATAILAQRDIFTPELRELVLAWEQQGGLSETEASRFVAEALETFRWHPDASIDQPTYQAMAGAHRLLADVVCFHGPHINHLTPRTLDIDAAQRLMPDYALTPKAIIEGPPRRQCPILLRQTSFTALDEPVRFADGTDGSHSARFGEIEQRGIALTAKGRQLYDRLLSQARQTVAQTEDQAQDNDSHQRQLSAIFEVFPDDYARLRQEGLAFFTFAAGNPHALAQDSRQAAYQAQAASDSEHLEALIAAGVIVAAPMLYEDFLPVSAAGIFQSNLGQNRSGESAGQANQAAFEEALGGPVMDELALYRQRQDGSLARALASLSPPAR